MSIPRETLGLAAEFAVASELCRRGVYAQLTLGNKKRTDLLIHNVATDNFLRIEVKAKQAREWPHCKGIYGQNVMLVFVDYLDKEQDERPDFFVLTVKDWRKVAIKHAKKLCSERPEAVGIYDIDVRVTERNVAVWKTKNGKPYEGTGVTVPLVEKHREAWDKIIAAAVPLAAEC